MDEAVAKGARLPFLGVPVVLPKKQRPAGEPVGEPDGQPEKDPRS